LEGTGTMETWLEFDAMRLEKKDRLARVTFTRERVLNAMNNAASEDLNRVAATLAADAQVRVVVICGAGRAFSSGIDLRELAAGQIDISYHHRWERALRTFEQMDEVVIVGLHGYCLGGALQLALACDIRASTESCRIGLPAAKECLILGLSTWRLPKYEGWRRAKKMILGGESISGDEALKIGLVDHLAAENGFHTALDRLACEYLRTCSLGTQLSKQLVNRSFERKYETIREEYFRLQERAQESPDATEAKRAYLEGREPEWE
jgi:enoyl-CoA hydratase/carnithine racemase